MSTHIKSGTRVLEDMTHNSNDDLRNTQGTRAGTQPYIIQNTQETDNPQVRPLGSLQTRQFPKDRNTFQPVRPSWAVATRLPGLATSVFNKLDSSPLRRGLVGSRATRRESQGLLICQSRFPSTPALPFPSYPPSEMGKLAWARNYKIYYITAPWTLKKISTR